jgi:hypothetical protein
LSHQKLQSFLDGKFDPELKVRSSESGTEQLRGLSSLKGTDFLFTVKRRNSRRFEQKATAAMR